MKDSSPPRPYQSDSTLILWPVLVILLAGMVVIVLAAGGRVSAVEMMGRGGLLVASAWALWLTKRSRIRAATTLVVCALVFAAVTAFLGYGSIRSIGSYGLAGAVVITGVFLGRRALVGMVLLSIAVVAVFAVAEVTGAIAPIDRPMDASQGITLALALGLLGSTVHHSRQLAATATTALERELEDRQQADATVRRTGERLRLSMEAARQGWFDLDIHTGAVVSSAEFNQIVGADPEGPAMTLQGWIDSIHHDDRPTVLEEFTRCLSSGETHQMEYRMKTRTGADIWIRSIAKVVERDKTGQPIRMTGTHADITDQMRVTLALRNSERQYRALVELSPLAIVVLREDAVVFANAAAVALFGAPSLTELMGTPLSAHVRADNADWLDPDATERDATEAAGHLVEQRLQRADGALLYVTVQRTPIMFEGENAVQLTLQDVSRRKQAEASRLRSRQLESLGTLAGGIAHDFNNILLAVRGNAELAAAQLDGEAPAVESLREIVRASARASSVVRRITAFGRPQQLDRRVIAMPAVIDEVLKLLRPTIPAGIALEVEPAGDIPPVFGDTAQLHEAIVNLTANAADAIGQKQVGTITYALDTVQVEGAQARALSLENGSYVQLSVTDTGRGMDAETMARAFDAFYTTKPVGEGSGLGLSMVYGILKSHNGAVLVHSTPGEGARFQLYLPVATEGTATEAEPLPAATPVLTAQRVLFVDDEAPLVKLAHRTLERVGHQVEGFTDPAAALDVFRNRPNDFDIIVTDLTMPVMSGLELARAARAIRADIPIVMATGDANATDAAEIAAAGVRCVAVKATGANQLVELVERGCRTAECEHAGASAGSTHEQSQRADGTAPLSRR